jgi:hypothetical protein
MTDDGILQCWGFAKNFSSKSTTSNYGITLHSQYATTRQKMTAGPARVCVTCDMRGCTNLWAPSLRFDWLLSWSFPRWFVDPSTLAYFVPIPWLLFACRFSNPIDPSTPINELHDGVSSNAWLRIAEPCELDFWVWLRRAEPCDLDLCVRPSAGWSNLPSPSGPGRSYYYCF